MSGNSYLVTVTASWPSGRNSVTRWWHSWPLDCLQHLFWQWYRKSTDNIFWPGSTDQETSKDLAPVPQGAWNTFPWKPTQARFIRATQQVSITKRNHFKTLKSSSTACLEFAAQEQYVPRDRELHKPSDDNPELLLGGGKPGNLLRDCATQTRDVPSRNSLCKLCFLKKKKTNFRNNSWEPIKRTNYI